MLRTKKLLPPCKIRALKRDILTKWIKLNILIVASIDKLFMRAK